MSTRAAVYARKSQEQAGPEEARSVARQVEGARAWVAARGWALEEAHVYKDDGVSGYLFLGRPAFQAMLRAAEAHAFEALVLYDLDRFGRNSRRTMEALHALADAGVAVWDYSTGKPVDLDTFEGRLTATLQAEFAQQFRESIRKKTRDAMRAKAARGEVPGKAPYGYRNVMVGDRKTVVVEEAKAAVVREVYRRFAAGQGVASIQRWLNTAGVKPPRGNRGWTSTTLRALLRNALYRGELLWNTTRMVYGRKAGKGRDGKGRERAQLPRPEEEWVRVPRPELRIVDEATVAAVDARLADGREAYIKGKAAGRAPHKGKGHYLLSGGMLICPDCGGHFEARKKGWQERGVYVCARRRNSPGTCPNRLALPLDITDAAVLNVLEGEVLGERYIAELLNLVESAPADEGLRLEAERDRLRGEVAELVEAIAKKYIAAEDAGAQIKERKAEVAKIEAALARPRPAAVDKAKLRAALEQRTTEWRAALRAEPEVARVMLRRLIGPITLWREEPAPAFIKKTDPSGKDRIGEGDVLMWGADVRPEALAEGLVEAPLGRSRTR